MNMEDRLTNTDVTLHFNGMVFAKSPLKSLSKQMGKASIALKLIIGPTALLYDDPHPITEHALWTVIAEGPLAIWLNHHIKVSQCIAFEAYQSCINKRQLRLTKIMHLKSCHFSR